MDGLKPGRSDSLADVAAQIKLQGIHIRSYTLCPFSSLFQSGWFPREAILCFW